MVRLGIVGIPTDWEQKFLPVLESLAPRVEVVAVFDHVRFRAARLAQALSASATGGVLALARRSDVDGILLLDNGWYGSAIWSHLSDVAKPVFLADDSEFDDELVKQIHTANGRSGALWMPELTLRYFPATYRLMELQATHCGTIRSLAMHWPVGEATAEIHHLVDWCRYVTGAAQVSIAEPVQVDGHSTEFRIEARAGHTIRVAVEFGQPFRAVAGCAQGRIAIHGPHDLEWTQHSDGRTDNDARREDLTDDRPGRQVMLDHFCRRVAGGLIPVPTLAELQIARQLARQIASPADTPH